MQQHRYSVFVEIDPTVFETDGKLPEKVLQGEIDCNLQSLKTRAADLAARIGNFINVGRIGPLQILRSFWPPTSKTA